MGHDGIDDAPLSLSVSFAPVDSLTYHIIPYNFMFTVVYFRIYRDQNGG